MNPIFADIPTTIFETMSALRARRGRSISAKAFPTILALRMCGARPPMP
jgi:hypothetical protein